MRVVEGRMRERGMFEHEMQIGRSGQNRDAVARIFNQAPAIDFADEINGGLWPKNLFEVFQRTSMPSNNLRASKCSALEKFALLLRTA